MLCVYGSYKYFNSFSAGTVFGRQNSTYKDGPRAGRVRLDLVLMITDHTYACLESSTAFYPNQWKGVTRRDQPITIFLLLLLNSHNNRHPGSLYNINLAHVA